MHKPGSRMNITSSLPEFTQAAPPSPLPSKPYYFNVKEVQRTAPWTKSNTHGARVAAHIMNKYDVTKTLGEGAFGCVVHAPKLLQAVTQHLALLLSCPLRPALLCRTACGPILSPNPND